MCIQRGVGMKEMIFRLLQKYWSIIVLTITRCALSSGNKRAAARAYEHLGRFDEAIGMLTRLGKTREADRVRKKKE